MEFKKLMTAAALMAAMTFGATTASANTGALAALKITFGSTSSDCFQCHLAGTAESAGTMNVFGEAWKATGADSMSLGSATTQAMTDLGNADVDKDGKSNLDEAVAGTLGTGLGAPSGGGSSDVGGDSGGGCITASAATPWMMFLGLLSLGFFVRRKQD